MGSLIERRIALSLATRLRVYRMPSATLTPLSERGHVMRNGHMKEVKDKNIELQALSPSGRGG